jgi:membrane dipeptidase
LKITLFYVTLIPKNMDKKKIRKPSKKSVWAGVWLLVLLLVIAPDASAAGDKKLDARLWEKAWRIHREALVVDTHTDTPMVIIEEKVDLGQEGLGPDKNDLDFPRMKKGGLDAVFFAVFVSNHLDKQHPARRALEMIDEIYRQVEAYPDLVQMAFSPGDIFRLHQAGKSAVLIGMENGGPLEGSLRLLRDYYRLGVRYITLTHNSHNDICDSSTGGKPRWNGLSPFGAEVVREMNRLGMMIDVSHISDQAFADVIRESQAPVFASHSCARALCKVPRNMTDPMIRELARKGGVIQINFYSAFLDETYKRQSDETWAQLEPEIKKIKEKYPDEDAGYWKAVAALWKTRAPEQPGISALIDHIDHVARLVGVDYVGLGSDYDGAGSFPRGLEDVTGYPLITYRLLERGYSEEDIKKVLGGNFLRFFKRVTEVAMGMK